jgi:hypothetical protein
MLTGSVETLSDSLNTEEIKSIIHTGLVQLLADVMLASPQMQSLSDLMCIRQVMQTAC